jgi:hypothetical protein
MVDEANDAEVIESVLAALVNICLDHEENCRRVLMKGVDALAKVANKEGIPTPEVERVDAADDMDDTEHSLANNNPQLANDLLHLLEPFNWIQCTNCTFKNEAGERCVKCGHKIVFSIL